MKKKRVMDMNTYLNFGKAESSCSSPSWVLLVFFVLKVLPKSKINCLVPHDLWRTLVSTHKPYSLSSSEYAPKDRAVSVSVSMHNELNFKFN